MTYRGQGAGAAEVPEWDGTKWITSPAGGGGGETTSVIFRGPANFTLTDPGTDHVIVICDKEGSGSMNVTLPAAPTTDAKFTIVDANTDGAGGSTPFSIDFLLLGNGNNIMGQANIAFRRRARGTFSLIFDGNEWQTMGGGPWAFAERIEYDERGTLTDLIVRGGADGSRLNLGDGIPSIVLHNDILNSTAFFTTRFPLRIFTNNTGPVSVHTYDFQQGSSGLFVLPPVPASDGFGDVLSRDDNLTVAAVLNWNPHGAVINVGATPHNAVSPGTGHNILLVDTNAIGAASTVNLPAAVNHAKITIKDSGGTAGGGTNTITVDGNGTQEIDGQLTQVINTNFGSLQLVSDGSDWFITASA